MKNKKIITYHKLVRNKVPEILENANKEAIYYIHEDNKDFDLELMKKIDEELNEFMIEWGHNNKSGMKNELADLMEVVYALIKRNGFAIDEIQDYMVEKRLEKGGFSKRIFLVEAEE